ncbi:hypothetical protein A4A49_52120 [Nicotiana attenuata]|uniref:Uncharacterized protein n=1 Tax=Nicotiana attenuata TaxID=49451 RepID=A0A314LA11_NICAT|nr:hypothetical protein A4A49_52120 [Nicotiana attenuata]
MVQELKEEVNEAPAPPPEPNHLEKTLTDIEKLWILLLTSGLCRPNRTFKWPPVFTGTNPTADPQDFLEEVEKATTFLELKDIANLWFKGLEKSRSEDAPPMIWSEAALAVLYETLNQDAMTVLEYNIKFEKIHHEERTNKEQNKKARTFDTFSAVPSSGKGQSNRGLFGPLQPGMETSFSSI